MAEVGPVPPSPPSPTIRPHRVPAEERDKQRQPPHDDEEAPPQADEEPAEEPSPGDGDGDDGKPHIDVYV